MTLPLQYQASTLSTIVVPYDRYTIKQCTSHYVGIRDNAAQKFLIGYSADYRSVDEMLRIKRICYNLNLAYSSYNEALYDFLYATH